MVSCVQVACRDCIATATSTEKFGESSLCAAAAVQLDYSAETKIEKELKSKREKRKQVEGVSIVFGIDKLSAIE